MESQNKDKTGTDFSFATIEEFDNHISKSIVGYDELVKDVLTVAQYFVERGTNGYDIGCSTGKLVKELAELYPSSTFVGIENEDNFRQHLQSKANAVFAFSDVFGTDMVNASFVTSLFTTQFISIRHRQKLFDKIYASMNKGGAFILCEKMLSVDSKFQDMLSFMYYDHKREHFTDEAILDKEKALRGIMKLLTYEEYVAMLNKAGFTRVQLFWKRYNFTGVIAIK